jgi:hypothetical protein
LQGASPEPESEPEILVIKEDKKRVPAGKEAAIEAEVCSFPVSSTGIDLERFSTVLVLFTSGN